MIVRGIDANNDWLYGKGRNDYRANVDAVAQNIKTRLQSFLGDCFFQTDAGIDWFNLLGSKDRLQLQLSINATILNTQDVTGIILVSSNLTQNRVFSIQYQVQTSYGPVNDIFQYDLTGSI
jgi:hypothetical protein